jgi:hypothetical protein
MQYLFVGDEVWIFGFYNNKQTNKQTTTQTNKQVVGEI